MYIMKNLINLSGGDRLNLRIKGQILLSESIKNGKSRQTQKEFASADEAQKACIKKEWESLKKGYVLQNSDAKAGEASLHVYIGGGYTGVLAFSGAEGELFVYKCGGYKEGRVTSAAPSRRGQTRLRSTWAASCAT